MQPRENKFKKHCPKKSNQKKLILKKINNFITDFKHKEKSIIYKNFVLTEATWKELLVPLWSISWHKQDTNRANISKSLEKKEKKRKGYSIS